MAGRGVLLWLGASMLLLGQLTSVRPDRSPVRPPLTWAVWVPDVTHTYTASTFTPDQDIEVTRVQAQFAGNGENCAAHPAITVSNGNASVTLSGTTLANDTGPVNISFVAGIPITVSVNSPAACLFAPSATNVVVQYTSR
jgi:hypothetical protein